MGGGGGGGEGKNDSVGRIITEIRVREEIQTLKRNMFCHLKLHWASLNITTATAAFYLTTNVH